MIGEDEARPLLAPEYGDAYALDDFVKRSHGCVVVVVEREDDVDGRGQWWSSR